jgi:hypothetical protein
MSLVRPQNIVELREALVKETGDYSLVGVDGNGDPDYTVDAGADYWIDKGILALCDLAPNLIGDTGQEFTLAVGEHVLALTRCNEVSYVRVTDPDGNEIVVERKEYQWLRDNYKKPLGTVEHGAPEYWALAAEGSVISPTAPVGTQAALQFFVSILAGGTPLVSMTGKFAYPPVMENSLLVAQTTAPSMAVSVNEGACLISGIPVRRSAAANTATMVAPVANPRIDRIVISSAGVVSIVEGTEAAAPVAPATPSGHFSLATVLHAVGEATILNAAITNNPTWCNL